MRKLWVKAWITLDRVFDADTMGLWWPPVDEAAVDYAKRLEYIAEEYPRGDTYLLGRPMKCFGRAGQKIQPAILGRSSTK